MSVSEGVASESVTIRRGREDLAAAHRLAVRDGLNEGTWNHFTLSHPVDGRRMFQTPSYTHWSLVTAENLVEVGPDFVADDEMEWTAYRIHHPLHEAREDAACVLHVHSPNLVAYSMLEEPRFRALDQNALLLAGRVAWTQEFDGLAADDEEQGRLMAEALGDSATILILRNHGAVVTGPTVADAYTDLYLLERVVQAQLMAFATGLPLRELGERELRTYSGDRTAGMNEFRRRHFEAMKDLLDAEGSDFRG